MGDLSFHIRGDYFESCNCEAICPCRMLRRGARLPLRRRRARLTLDGRVARGRTRRRRYELHADELRVWDEVLTGDCAFAGDFDYESAPVS